MIEFIQPKFNSFTLEFPPPTLAEIAKSAILASPRHLADELEYVNACHVRSIARADLQRVKRTRNRLQSYISGGWVIEFEPRQHLGLQTSKRGEQRRAQLGRE